MQVMGCLSRPLVCKGKAATQPVNKYSGAQVTICVAILGECLMPFADMGELNLDSTTSVNFPQGKEKIMSFEITIKPIEGMYR